MIMYVGLLAVKIAFPSSKHIIAETWKSAVGQLPTLVMDHTKVERAKFFERGQKFFWLIVAWFAFFLIFELALRGIIFVISKAIKVILSKDSTEREKRKESPVNEVHAEEHDMPHD